MHLLFSLPSIKMQVNLVILPNIQCLLVFTFVLIIVNGSNYDLTKYWRPNKWIQENNSYGCFKVLFLKVRLTLHISVENWPFFMLIA